MLALALVAGLSACTELPPYGEAIVVVDTDVPLRLAERLRVDVYSAEGQWIASQGFLQAQPSDWPASFSVQAPMDDFAGEAVVRLRLYPSGRTRDYRGERFGPTSFEPAPVQRSLVEACAAPFTQAVGEARWHRLGIESFAGPLSGGGCSGYDSGLGAALVRVDLAEPGSYRFAILDSEPSDMETAAIQLRTSCDVDATALACAQSAQGPQASIDVPSLVPGPYWLVILGDHKTAPADVLVGVERTDLPSGLQSVPREPVDALPANRLELEGAATPESEPIPEVAIDRLVRLPLRDGVRATVPVVLAGACLGTQARLRADPSLPGVVPTEAESCVASEGLREPVDLEEGELAWTQPASRLGTFPPADDCSGVPSTDDEVCVPGGVFLLGSLDGALTMGDSAPRPERAARVSSFLIDRREVTVRDWREAMVGGFVPPSPSSASPNDAPYPTSLAAVTSGVQVCTYSTTDIGREDWPLNCVSWRGARAYCAHRGGDLPTAAQWEYVATAAGRAEETLLPWGDDPPRCSTEDCLDIDQPCHAAVYSRLGDALGTCLAAGFGPIPVMGYETPNGDRTIPLDGRPEAVVFGLAGGVMEMLLDSHHSYDGACWRTAGLTDPTCREEHAVWHEVRGSSWGFSLPMTFSAARDRVAHARISPLMGFRCAYPVASR